MPIMAPMGPIPEHNIPHYKLTEVVIFAIHPNSKGALVTCSFDSAVNIITKSESKNFHLSRAFVKEACNALSHGKWKVSPSREHHVKIVYDFCFWSKAIPNKPICSARLEQNP